MNGIVRNGRPMQGFGEAPRIYPPHRVGVAGCGCKACCANGAAQAAANVTSTAINAANAAPPMPAPTQANVQIVSVRPCVKQNPCDTRWQQPDYPPAEGPTDADTRCAGCWWIDQVQPKDCGGAPGVCGPPQQGVGQPFYPWTSGHSPWSSPPATGAWPNLISGTTMGQQVTGGGWEAGAAAGGSLNPEVRRAGAVATHGARGPVMQTRSCPPGFRFDPTSGNCVLIAPSRGVGQGVGQGSYFVPDPTGGGGTIYEVTATHTPGPPVVPVSQWTPAPGVDQPGGLGPNVRRPGAYHPSGGARGPVVQAPSKPRYAARSPGEQGGSTVGYQTSGYGGPQGTPRQEAFTAGQRAGGGGPASIGPAAGSDAGAGASGGAEGAGGSLGQTPLSPTGPTGWWRETSPGSGNWVPAPPPEVPVESLPQAPPYPSADVRRQGVYRPSGGARGPVMPAPTPPRRQAGYPTAPEQPLYDWGTAPKSAPSVPTGPLPSVPVQGWEFGPGTPVSAPQPAAKNAPEEPLLPAESTEEPGPEIPTMAPHPTPEGPSGPTTTPGTLVGPPGLGASGVVTPTTSPMTVGLAAALGGVVGAVAGAAVGSELGGDSARPYSSAAATRRAGFGSLMGLIVGSFTGAAIAAPKVQGA